MDELYAMLPDLKETFVGEFLEDLSYDEWTGEPLELDGLPYYDTVVRAIKGCDWLFPGGETAEIILASGEVVSVKIVRVVVHICRRSPVPIETLLSTPISINAEGLSREQARQARFIVQHLNPR